MSSPAVWSEAQEPIGTAGRSVARAAFSRRYAGLWVLAAMVLGFGLLDGDVFLTSVTFKTILADQSVTGLLAFAILVPYVAGVFDLSVASVAGFSMVLSSWLCVETSLPVLVLFALVLVASAGFGLLSAVLVTRIQVNSLVASLGINTVALGVTQYIAAGNSIAPEFGDAATWLGQGYLFDILPVPFACVLLLGAFLYYILEHTACGRRLLATGGNETAARLAGISVTRVQAGVLLTASLISGFTGLVLATKIGVATDTTAPGYLFPAFAALLFGATQLKDRPNVWGTIVALLILGTGVKGLQLLGASAWVNDFFAGTVLLIAVSISYGGASRR